MVQVQKAPVVLIEGSVKKCVIISLEIKNQHNFMPNSIENYSFQAFKFFKLGVMKQGRGTCSMFQSFLVILPNVPCTYCVHRYIKNVPKIEVRARTI